MKTLIIYTHPSPTGFNAAILKEVQSNLSKKHEVKTLDLYAENFDPILRFDQEHRRRDLHKDPEMAKYRDLITWADQLIFIFPIWWSSMPAILKGFIDRVFAADFAYLTLIKKLASKATCKASPAGLSPATTRLLLPCLLSKTTARY